MDSQSSSMKKDSPPLTTSTGWKKRAARDIENLQKNGFPVQFEKEDDMSSIITFTHGPSDSPYEGYSWQIRFTIPDGYPFSSPSVGFIQRIYHPNVDEESGSICLDALNKNWSPSFNLKHIVEVLIPYLLSYPNPDDPLNREAAALLKQNKSAFEALAKDYARTHGLKKKKS